MKAIVNSESVPLIPEFQERIEVLLGRITPLLTEGAELRMFIKPAAHETFKVLIHVRDHHHAFVYEQSGERVLNCVREAVNQVRRRLLESKDKLISKRRYREPRKVV